MNPKAVISKDGKHVTITEEDGDTLRFPINGADDLSGYIEEFEVVDIEEEETEEENDES